LERTGCVSSPLPSNAFISHFLQLIKFSGVAAGEACTVVLRGPTNQMVDEAGRSLHDALSVLSPAVKETRIVLSGGCAEMLMSCAVENEARSVKGKKGLAVEAFGQALKQIPMILANNAGYDTSGVVSRLRSESSALRRAFGCGLRLSDPDSG
jgi:T-complex protein 1 subunit beta